MAEFLRPDVWIPAAAAVIGVWISYWFGRRAERARQETERYERIISTARGLYKQESQNRADEFARAYDGLWAWGSDDVVKAANELFDRLLQAQQLQRLARMVVEDPSKGPEPDVKRSLEHSENAVEQCFRRLMVVCRRKVKCSTNLTSADFRIVTAAGGDKGTPAESRVATQ